MKARQLLLLIAAMACSLFAAAQTTSWQDDGNVDISWYDNNPATKSYNIGTPQQLAGLAKLVNEGGINGYPIDFWEVTITLDADLDLSAHNWVPIGITTEQTRSSFCGSFDGNNKVIRGLNINTDNTTHQSIGLFGSIFAGGESFIKDLTLENGLVKVDNNAPFPNFPGIGALVGVVAAQSSVRGPNLDKINIENCHNINVKVVGGGVGGGTGGLVGACDALGKDAKSSMINIANCSNTGEVEGQHNRTGGIIGTGVGRTYFTPGFTGISGSGLLTISDCRNTGNIKGSDIVAGIIGEAQGRAYIGNGTAEIINCYNTGEIVCEGGSEGLGAVGGIVGDGGGTAENNNSDAHTNQGTLAISDCYNTGNIIGHGIENSHTYIGGIMGRGGSASSTEGDTGYFIIDNCYNAGSITSKTGTPYSTLGGIIGDCTANSYNSGTGIVSITNCYNTGGIEKENEETVCIVGGIIGVAGGSNGPGSITVNYCYNAGAITGPQITELGGIIGGTSWPQSISIQNCLVISPFPTTYFINPPRISSNDIITLSNNYAYIPGNLEYYFTPAADNKYGADWDGRMTSLPVSNWDPAVWEIDHTGAYMPWLKLPDAPKVANPASGEPGIVHVTGISLNLDLLEMNIGETRLLEAAVQPANASNTKVSWDSDDDDVASVSQAGLITAHAAGTATITVRSEDGNHTGACTVIVQTPILQPGNQEEVDESGKGSFELMLSIPLETTFTGSMTLALPAGMTLSEAETKLSDDLAGEINLSATALQGNIWRFEFTEAPLRSTGQPEYRKIMDIVYTVADGLPDGQYTIKATNISLKLNDDTMLAQGHLDIPVNVSRTTTGIRLPSADAKDLLVYLNARTNVLTINNKAGVIGDVSIIGMDGRVAFRQNGIQSTQVELNVGAYPKGIYIVQVITKGEIKTQKILIR